MGAIQLKVNPNEKVAFVGDLHFDTTVSSRLDNFLDTCCKKIHDIGEICEKENIKYLFFAGDIFNKITCNHECVNRAGASFLDLRAKGIRVFSICGNHDLPRDSLAKLKQSPIETLFSFGVLEHISLESPIEIYDVNSDTGKLSSLKITACDFTQKVPDADKNFDKNILLAHMFFDKSGFLGGDDQNITKDKMFNYGYDMAFLGHDHEEYDTVLCGKTLVVRSGSIMRGAVHDYNFKRIPGIVILDDVFNPHNIRKVNIPCANFKDVISQSALNRKASNKQDNLNYDALQSLADKLAQVKQDEENKDVILDVIQNDMNLSDNRRKILLNYISKVG